MGLKTHEFSTDVGAGYIHVICDGNLMVYPLPSSGQLVIGRSEDADIRIQHASVSREHALLRIGPPCTIEDLGSLNGTQLQGQRLVPKQPQVFGPDQVIAIGAVLLVRQGTNQETAVSQQLLSGESTYPANDPVETKYDANDLEAVDIVVRDPEMKKIYELTERISKSDLNCVLLGETGVGKQVVAELLHRSSPRASEKFVHLNCATLPENLLESELFGYEAGAFTGARKRKIGLLESARGGTVFLDEVAEMPLTTQAKLLQAVETGGVMPVGGIEKRPIHVRYVSATNRDIEAEIARGHFRRDLFYRLNGITIAIPPLRERPVEIIPLAERFASRIAKQMAKPPPELSPEARAVLEEHAWPGNVRELRNVIERAVVLCNDGVIGVEHLPKKPRAVSVPDTGNPSASRQGPPRSTDRLDAETFRYAIPSQEELYPEKHQGSLKSQIFDLERDRIMRALDACAGNQAAASEMLGISRSTLVRRLDYYNIPRPRKRR